MLPVDSVSLANNGDELKGSSDFVSKVTVTSERVARIRRKVDIRLLPILGAIFATSVMDRSNLANAFVSGANKEIGLGKGNRYTVATMAFLIPYVLLEIPSNLLAYRVRAPIYLSTIGLLWGVVMISMGFVKTWRQVIALRVLIGVLEAGFFPACVWLISCWYTRAEVQVRMTAFFMTSTVVTAFANILAYGLSSIQVGRLHGWRWILIIEGIITCVLSILGYFVILDFPDRSTFLSPEDTALMKERVERDRADGKHDTLTFSKALVYACDLKLWSFGVAFSCATMAAIAYQYFTPIVLIGLGFSVKNAQLMVASTLLCAAFFTFILSILSDRYQHRAGFIILQALITLTGLSLTVFHPNNKVRLAGAFLGVTGAQGNIPALLTYQANNVRGQSKRAYASGLQAAFGGIGGTIAAVSYRQKDAPRYRLGIIVTIALEVLLIVLVAVNTVYFTYRNRQVRKGGKQIEGHPGFLYFI